MFFRIAKKVSKYLGYFSLQNCHQEISQIAQSGHSDIICIVTLIPSALPTQLLYVCYRMR